MNFSPVSGSAFAAAAAGSLVASLWEGLVLVAAVAVLFRLLPGLSAAVRSAIWTAVLLLVVALPGLSLLGSSHVSAVAGLHGVRAGLGWSEALLAVWAGLSLLRAAQLAASAVRLHGILRRAVPLPANATLTSLLRRGGRAVELCVSADVERPSVAGFLRPRVLLPEGLAERMSAVELTQVVLHETEHLRRRDDWINLLQKLALVVFPLSPALFWLDRKLCAERELACDDGVLRRTGSPKAYAACLARLAEMAMVKRGLTLALGLLGGTWGRQRGPELAARVYRILGSPAQVWGRGRSRAVTALLLTGVLVGGTELARCPQLVSFGAAAAPVTAEIVPSSSRFAAVPVGYSASTQAQPHATLVKAILPVPAPGSQPVRAVALPARSPRRVGRFERRASLASAWKRVAVAQPYTLRRSVGLNISAQPFVVLTAWRPVSPSAVLTLAVFDDSQTSYAAVPTRGGWLVIQL